VRKKRGGAATVLLLAKRVFLGRILQGRKTQRGKFKPLFFQGKKEGRTWGDLQLSGKRKRHKKKEEEREKRRRKKKRNLFYPDAESEEKKREKREFGPGTRVRERDGRKKKREGGGRDPLLG